MTEPQAEKRPVVVLADDGAPASDVAWAWLTSHRWVGWDLQNVTARRAATPGGADLKPSRFVRRRPPEEACLASWDRVEVEGDPRVALQARADASLLVVGRHHRRQLAGRWAASTTDWLLVDPPAPILIARHGHPTRSVVLCADGGAHTQRALQAFWALPWAGDVAVHVVSVDDGFTDVERSLKVACATVPSRGRPAAVARLAGPARRELVGFVQAHQIDLVVMGTRGLTGLRRLRVGSPVSALLKDGSANSLIAHVPDPETARLGRAHAHRATSPTSRSGQVPHPQPRPGRDQGR